MESMELTEKIAALLVEKFGGKRDTKAKWDASVIVPAEYLHNVVEFLKGMCEPQRHYRRPTLHVAMIYYHYLHGGILLVANLPSRR